MRPLSRLVIGSVLIACAASAEPLPKAEIVATLKTLRQIEAANLKGQSDALRIGYQDRAREHPSDFMARVYATWCLGASNEGWNTLHSLSTQQRENPWPQLGMGRIFVKWKMKDQARPVFERLLKSDPGFFPALTGLGELERSRGEWAKAERQYRAALAIQDDAEARAGLGLVLLAQDKPDAARTELERAVTLWPEQPEALGALVELSKSAGDVGSAARSAQKLVDLAPKDAKARRTLADLRFDAGEKAAAATEYEALVKLGAVDTPVVERLASLYRALDDRDGEERALKQLSSLQSEESAHPLRLAELAEARGSVEDAEAQLAEAARRAPKRADVFARTAKLRMEHGRLRQALEALRAAQAAPEGEKPASLADDSASLAAQLRLPKPPAKGSVDQIYRRVSATLNALYLERLKEREELSGMIKARVRVDKDGRATEVELLEDSVQDPIIEGHVYFALKDAAFPKQKREPVFEFELKPPKKKE